MPGRDGCLPYLGSAIRNFASTKSEMCSLNQIRFRSQKWYHCGVRELTRGRLAAAHDHAGDENGGEKYEGSHDEGDEGEEDGTAEGPEDHEPVPSRP